jgi:UDP-glucuronate decarboxylase
MTKGGREWQKMINNNIMNNQLQNLISEDCKKIINTVDLSELKGKTIIITGASGIVGNYFVASLWQFLNTEPANTKVVAITQNQPLPYFKKFLDYSGSEIMLGDLSDVEFLKSLPNADYIIHAAGYGQPGRFMEDQIKTIKLNTSSTFALFEKLNPGGKFLFISTSEVYSGNPNYPYKEDMIGTTNTDHPRSCYIEAKRCGEAICNAYRTKGIQAKSARLSLAYGPGTKPNDQRVLNQFIQRAINGEIRLMDQGEAKRTYCYVADAVEIMWNILLNGKEAIYNVGGHSKTTIGELASKIGKYMDVPVLFPETSATLSGSPEDVSLDMTKAETEFNKKGYVGLDEGLKRTIEWQKILYDSKM